LEALSSEMMVALANPERFTDPQRDEIVARYNAAVMAPGQSGQTETVDVAQVHRETVEAGADPSKLTGEQRAELLRRYDRATREQQPTARTGADLAERLEAARQPQERGEEVDVDGLMPQFQTWQEQQVAAGRYLANLPLELQETARTIYAASEAMNRPADPGRGRDRRRERLRPRHEAAEPGAAAFPARHPGRAGARTRQHYEHHGGVDHGQESQQQ
jgi:hypothetical protein